MSDFENEIHEDLEKITAKLLKFTGDQRQGLPPSVFRMVSQLTPMVNIDLLIKDEVGRTLLSWRADEFYGPGWHIPGGIIRFKEKISLRIAKLAKDELGCDIKCSTQPIAVHELMATTRDVRGHFISLLYHSTLLTQPNLSLQAIDPILKTGEWRWFDHCPKNLIAQHEIYRNKISLKNVQN